MQPRPIHGRPALLFIYPASVVALAANGTTTANIAIQSGDHFLLRKISADFDQSDWTFNVNVSSLSRNLFDNNVRGAAVFGQANAAGRSSVWPHGIALAKPMLINANSTISITVTNGATGVLNLYFAFVGELAR